MRRRPTAIGGQELGDSKRPSDHQECAEHVRVNGRADCAKDIGIWAVAEHGIAHRVAERFQCGQQTVGKVARSEVQANPDQGLDGCNDDDRSNETIDGRTAAEKMADRDHDEVPKRDLCKHAGGLVETERVRRGKIGRHDNSGCKTRHEDRCWESHSIPARRKANQPNGPDDGGQDVKERGCYA
ncbi:MAG: hypothetical protein EBT47_08530 [Chloroflexi bacterium]|nr:hypothetical protein [Chloroflexota bacterium]